MRRSGVDWFIGRGGAALVESSLAPEIVCMRIVVCPILFFLEAVWLGQATVCCNALSG